MGSQYHLALLETVFLVHRLPAWSRNLGKRLVKAPKVHLVDSGLACHFVGTDAQRLCADRTLLGRLLESFVVGELRKQVSWVDPRIAICHSRTSAGTEIDVILEWPDGSVAAIEIKASDTVTGSDRPIGDEVADTPPRTADMPDQSQPVLRP